MKTPCIPGLLMIPGGPLRSPRNPVAKCSSERDTWGQHPWGHCKFHAF